MTTTFTSKFRRKLIGGALLGVVLSGCVGCQTFSLSEEDFEKQQRGEMVDSETGFYIGALGILGYYGGLAGGAAARAAR